MFLKRRNRLAVVCESLGEDFMPVDGVVTPFAEEHFGDQAVEVMRRVVQALTDAQRAGVAAQGASGLRGKHPYGSTWNAKFDFMVAAFRDLPGVTLARPEGVGYRLVVLNGRLLVPFQHAKTLATPITEAQVRSAPLRGLTSEAVARPPSPWTLFDDDPGSDDPGSPGPDDAAVPLSELGSELTVVYIGFASNADTDRLLAAWWGVPTAQDDEGNLTWNPEPLPLHLAAEQTPAAATDAGAGPGAGLGAAVAGFDQGEIPQPTISPRPRKPAAPPVGDSSSGFSAGGDA